MPHRVRYSLRASLLTLVSICIFPVTLICVGLIYAQYQLHREKLFQSSLLTACKVVADLDRELAAIESALKILATSQDLRDGDFAKFYTNASLALPSGIVYNYVLTDRSGAQILNTVLPYGSSLPKQGTPPEIAEVFLERRTRLTGLFSGPVTGRHAIAMGVPVIIDDEVRYSLNVGLAPSEVNSIISREQLSDGWLIAVLDQYGTIVGRSREADRFVGQKPVSEVFRITREAQRGTLTALTKEGSPAITAFCTSEIWNWQVVVGAPMADLDARLSPTVRNVTAATLVIVVTGTLLALALANRILTTIKDLNSAAARVASGEMTTPPIVQLKEAEAVGLAITKAGALLQEIKFLAQHDSLTGLANRRLFEELATHQMDLTRRHKSRFAIAAIDLDGFKRVNDEMGHAIGDEILRSVAYRLHNTIRSSDIAARIGGDEFIILLCDTSIDSAKDTAQRIVDALSAPYLDSNIAISGSVGLSFFPDHGETLDRIVQAADAALYKAKHQGKARVEIANLRLG